MSDVEARPFPLFKGPMPDDAWWITEFTREQLVKRLAALQAQADLAAELQRKLDFAGIPESWFQAHQDESGEWVEPEPGKFCGHEPRCQTIWEHVEATTKAKHDLAVGLRAALEKAPEVLVSFDTYFDWLKEVCEPALNPQPHHEGGEG